MKKLSHLDPQGRARMVDVGGKPATPRTAIASALVRMAPGTLDLIATGDLPKGDALGVARLAGIQGAKWTPHLIPLCHPLALDDAAVLLVPDPAAGGIRVHTRVSTRGPTGVEMEALTAAAVAGLTVIDMVKAVDRTAGLDVLRLELKEGGKSGRWIREGFVDPWAGEAETP